MSISNKHCSFTSGRYKLARGQKSTLVTERLATERVTCIAHTSTVPRKDKKDGIFWNFWTKTLWLSTQALKFLRNPKSGSHVFALPE